MSEMKKLLKDNDLKPFEWRSFQISPMYGAPRKYRYLLPILSNKWKFIMGIKLGKKNSRRMDQQPSNFEKYSF